MGRTIVPVCAGLALAIGLPVVGHLSRLDRKDRCAFDGVRINPVYRVTVCESIADSQLRCLVFCSVDCAAQWVERRPSTTMSVSVTDELTGEQLDASQAFFVRSSIVTVTTNGNRIHVFKDRDQAEQHVKAAHGKFLDQPERPFTSVTGSRLHELTD